MQLRANAVVVGDRLNSRDFAQLAALAQNPLMVEVPGGGTVALFRFGVVVFFDVPLPAQSAFLEMARHLVKDAVPRMDLEEGELEIRVDPQRGDSVDQGVLYLADDDISRLQVTADILAKSALLSSYETRIGSAFERIEPLAKKLQQSGRGGRQARDLVRHIGETMLIQHRMVARAQVADKPEILWERPELDRLYHRLEQEFEISERVQAQDRKLALLGSTAETLLELLQSQRSLRVEWYIVLLIVLEVALTLYELFVKDA